MATFAKSTYNASVYSASRPTYPKKLFDYIFNYHRQKPDARWERAVDLGCGTGQATKRLGPAFREIIGLDPSENMIKAAVANREFLSAPSASGNAPSQFQFRRGSAEDLKSAGIENESVDMVIAAQACHWFNWSKVWPEMDRVLKAGGTAAFWIYSEFRLPQYPSLTPQITAFAQGKGKDHDPVNSLGSYFERPGRTILENHLLDVPSCESVLGKIKGSSTLNESRVYFAGDYHIQTLPPTQTLPIIMHKEMRWRDLLGYFRTWSSLHKYHEVYPEDKKRKDDIRFLEEDLAASESSSTSPSSASLDDVDVTCGDIAVRFWKNLRSGARDEVMGRNGQSLVRVGVDDIVVVEWPLALILASKT